MKRSAANSIVQLLVKSAHKASGGARSRRAFGAKGIGIKAAANVLPRLRILAVVGVVAWTFFLYVHFTVISNTVEVSDGDGLAADPCRGRYIYMHDLPPRFNTDIIRNCAKTEDHWGDMCGYVSNAGLGCKPVAVLG